MMRKLALGTGAAVLALGLTAAPASAQASPTEGAECVEAGVATLEEAGLLEAAALQQIDYSTLADEEDGPIYADLPEGSYLSLPEVISLHYTNPELFAWCD